MREKPRYHAFVPINEIGFHLETRTLEEMDKEVNKLLISYEKKFPFKDFRAAITIVRGRKLTHLVKK